jgi:hypothetical protein
MSRNGDSQVLGVDFGTDSVRAVLFDEAGDTVASRVEHYPRWRQGLYCDTAENRYGLTEIEASGLIEVLIERHAVEELHDVVLATVGKLAETENVDDVLRLDLVDAPRLGDKARDHLRIGREPKTEHLDRNLLADERVLRTVDRSESANADLSSDDVLTNLRSSDQLGVELRADVGVVRRAHLDSRLCKFGA